MNNTQPKIRALPTIPPLAVTPSPTTTPQLGPSTKEELQNTPPSQLVKPPSGSVPSLLSFTVPNKYSLSQKLMEENQSTESVIQSQKQKTSDKTIPFQNPSIIQNTPCEEFNSLSLDSSKQPSNTTNSAQFKRRSIINFDSDMNVLLYFTFPSVEQIEQPNNTNTFPLPSPVSVNNTKPENIEVVAPKRPSKRAPHQVPNLNKVNNQGPLDSTPLSPIEISVTSPQERAFNNYREKYIAFLEKEGLIGKNTAARDLVLNLTFAQFKEEVNSYLVITGLPEGDDFYVAFNRDFYHLSNRQASKESNEKMLNRRKEAWFLGAPNSDYFKPGNEVSFLLKTTLQPHSGKTVRPHIVAIALPVLSDRDVIRDGWGDGKQVSSISVQQIEVSREMAVFLDTSTNPPTLNTKAYKTTLETTCKHVLEAAETCKPKRVVFSASGITDSLNSLDEIDNILKNNSIAATSRNTALGIAACAHASMIKQLRAEGIEVYYMDMIATSGTQKTFINQTYWQAVNSALSMIKGGKITPVDSDDLISKNWTTEKLKKSTMENPFFWVKDHDLVIIPYNSKTLIGNGMKNGGSLNDIFGSRTTLNFIDAWNVDQGNKNM